MIFSDTHKTIKQFSLNFYLITCQTVFFITQS